jgi:hypothetical protein
VGKADRTEFTIISLPAYVSRLLIPIILLLILLIKGKKSSTEGLGVPRGKPRLVKGVTY